MEQNKNGVSLSVIAPVKSRPILDALLGGGCSIVLAAALVASAQAGDWQVTPAFRVQGIYSDNINIAPPDLAESDFVTELAPGILINGISSRFNVDIAYFMQGLLYADHGGENTINNLYRGDATAELFQDHLYLDLLSQNVQRNINAGGQVVLDNFSISSNRTDVLTYGASPYWLHDIGGYSDIEARYTYDVVDIADPAFADSTGNEFLLEAVSGRHFTRFLWTGLLQYSDVDYEFGNQDVTFLSVGAELRYVISRKWALIGGGGYEDNEFESTVGETSGPFWSAGFAWTPNSRTSLEITGGDRFFGETYFVDFSHRTRRTEWILNFTKEPVLTRQGLNNPANQAFAQFDAFGNPVNAVAAGPGGALIPGLPTQTTEVYIRQRFETIFRWTLTRNILEANVYNEDRDWQFRNQQGSSKGAGGSWEHLLGPKTNSLVSVIYEDNTFIQNPDNNILVVEASLNRRLANTLEASIGYRFADIESDNPLFTYTENRGFISLTKEFGL